MRIFFRPQRKDETDWEAVVGLGIVPMSLLVCVTLMKWFPGFLPRCRFHDLTGIPCPCCGSLKSAEFLTRGRLPEAFFAQPLGCIAILAGVAWLLYSAAVVMFRLPRPRLRASRREWLAVAAGATAAGLANWACLILSGD